MAVGLMLDFIREKRAPEFYNQGVYDSHRYREDAMEDLLSIQKLEGGSFFDAGQGKYRNNSDEVSPSRFSLPAA